VFEPEFFLRTSAGGKALRPAYKTCGEGFQLFERRGKIRFYVKKQVRKAEGNDDVGEEKS